MPIRINLLTESLAEQELSRRDPVKRAIFISALLVSISLVWFSSTWLNCKLAQKDFSQVQDARKSLTNDYNRVLLSMKTLSEGEERLGALQQLSTNRFLQGNLLNALQKIYVPNVQLTRLRMEQNCIYTPGSPAKTNGSVVVPKRPATVVEQNTLTLDARDFSPNPGDQVNPFKDAILQSEFFKNSLNKTNGVRLLNLSAPQPGPNGKSSVQFTLECRFPDITR